MKNLGEHLSEQARQEIKASLSGIDSAIDEISREIKRLKGRQKKLIGDRRSLALLVGVDSHDAVKSPEGSSTGVEGLRDFIEDTLRRHRQITIDDLTAEAEALGFDFHGKSPRHMVSSTFQGIKLHSKGRYAREGDLLIFNQGSTNDQ